MFPGSLPDTVLLHEMIHGLRQIQGRDNKWPMTGSVRDYENEEEFLAIQITNVYTSSKGGTRPSVAGTGSKSCSHLSTQIRGFWTTTRYGG
jgi:hypothetical protein